VPDPGARRAFDLAVVAVLTLALCAYALVALAVAHWWVSGLAAPLVAALLAGRHARARFSAYVFLSVVGARGVMTAHWAPLAFAAAGILLLQTPPALRAWPRVSTPARMARP
jgi:hypothetical protein